MQSGLVRNKNYRPYKDTYTKTALGAPLHRGLFFTINNKYGKEKNEENQKRFKQEVWLSSALLP